VNYFE